MPAQRPRRDRPARAAGAWARTLVGVALLGATFFGATACGGAESSGPEAKAASAPAEAKAPTSAPSEPLDDDALAERYVAIREALDADPPPSAKTLAALQADLEQIAESARDVHLRANASLVLGSILEGKGDQKGAIGQYRHATKLVPDDAGPYMALARALAAAADYEAALAAQEDATTRDPDNLENWLALGELALRLGDEARATAAYVDYERRRKGLIDGLTLKNKAGEYLVSESERIGCAEALAAASDAGTAVALIYALATDESAKVRAAVASVMGIQRLSGYTDALKARETTEPDAGAREAVQWALGEILRDPVKLEPGPRAALAPGDPRAKPAGVKAPTQGDAPKPTE